MKTNKEQLKEAQSEIDELIRRVAKRDIPQLNPKRVPNYWMFEPYYARLDDLSGLKEFIIEYFADNANRDISYMPLTTRDEHDTRPLFVIGYHNKW